MPPMRHPNDHEASSSRPRRSSKIATQPSQRTRHIPSPTLVLLVGIFVTYNIKQNTSLSPRSIVNTKFVDKYTLRIPSLDDLTICNVLVGHVLHS